MSKSSSASVRIEEQQWMRPALRDLLKRPGGITCNEASIRAEAAILARREEVREQARAIVRDLSSRCGVPLECAASETAEHFQRGLEELRNLAETCAFPALAEGAALSLKCLEHVGPGVLRRRELIWVLIESLRLFAEEDVTSCAVLNDLRVLVAHVLRSDEG